MATVIDSLVVTLGLDPSGFTQGQKDAAAAMLKTKDAALKQSSELETANKKFAESFNSIKLQAAELFAVLASAAGVKAFVTDITNATAALGRLSVNLGVAPQEMGAWGLAIERVGGQASEAAGDFQELSTQLFDLQQNGKNIPVGLQRLAGISGDKIDYKHGIPEYLHSIGKAVEDFQRLGGSRSDAFNFLKQSGIGPGMAQLLLDNGSAIDKVVGSLKGLAPTDKQIKDFEALQTSFVALQQRLTAFGRQIVDDFAAPMQKAAKILTDFVAANENLASGKVFSWLKTMKDDAQAVADVLNKIVDAEKWLGEHGPGALGAAIANKFGPSTDKSPAATDPGHANAIPWGDWFNNVKKYFSTEAHADTLDDLKPGRGNSGPHPAPGLFIQGQQVSRGNPLPVTVVLGRMQAAPAFGSG